MGNSIQTQSQTKDFFKMLGGFITKIAGGQTEPEVKIIQKTDPQILQQLEELRILFKQSQQRLEQARRQAIKAADPKLFKEKKQQIFVAFLQNLKQYKFTDKINKNGKKHHMIIGGISVGKSSLLNKLLNLVLKTGVGETTDKTAVVASNGFVQILDSPGANDDFNFYDINTLALFHCVDRVFLLYRTSLKDVKDILRIMKIIKPDDTYLIRTQCDTFSEEDFKTLDQELNTDKRYMEEVIGAKFPIFGTSAKKGMDYAENQIVANLIKGIDE